MQATATGLAVRVTTISRLSQTILLHAFRPRALQTMAALAHLEGVAEAGLSNADADAAAPKVRITVTTPPTPTELIVEVPIEKLLLMSARCSDIVTTAALSRHMVSATAPDAS